MARTSYINLPAGLEESFYSGLRPSDRFQFSSIRRNDSLLSRRRKRGVSQRSLLPQISAIWQAFSDAERLAWTNAAAEMSLKGWQLFVQDQSIRIVNDIAGVATPSLLHQSWVGEIKISAPADDIELAQYHPHTYWIQKKVYGSKGMYEPIKITEDFSLPLTISINYKSNLVATSSPAYAYLRARVWHSYQGADLYEDLDIPFDLVADWKNATDVVNSLRGYVIGYTLFLKINNLQGELYFDNIKAEHGGQNWVRDPFSKQIAKTFSKQYFQVPQNWAPVNLPNGAEYDSVYLDF